MSIKHIVAFLFLSLFFFYHNVSSAFADWIEVYNADSEEVRKLEVKPGQAVDIMVYLKSFGDMVDNYLVILRTDEDGKRVAAFLSDINGRVKFAKVPPAKYHVEVNKKVRTDGRMSNVSIGDVMLSESGKDSFTLGGN